MKRSTHGFTLIEVLLAMMLLSAMLTVVAVTLGGMARADRRTRNRIDQQHSLHRLTMKLRQDIHGAKVCTISDVEDSPAIDLAEPGAASADRPAITSSTPWQTISLTRGDGRTTTFQANEHGIVRTVSLEGANQHREFFKLASGATATWTMDTAQELPLVVLTLAIPNGPDRSAERHQIRTTLLSGQPPSEE